MGHAVWLIFVSSYGEWGQGTDCWWLVNRAQHKNKTYTKSIGVWTQCYNVTSSLIGWAHSQNESRYSIKGYNIPRTGGHELVYINIRFAGYTIMYLCWHFVHWVHELQFVIFGTLGTLCHVHENMRIALNVRKKKCFPIPLPPTPPIP